MDKTNKCPICGAPRVKGSTLCVYCMISQNEKQTKTIKELRAAVERVRLQVKRQISIINTLMYKAMVRNEEIVSLRCKIAETAKILGEAVENADDGMA